MKPMVIWYDRKGEHTKEFETYKQAERFYWKQLTKTNDCHLKAF